MSSRGAIQLLGNGCHLRRQCDLVVVAAPAEVDQVGVVRVAQDAAEEPVTEALAVTPKEFERLAAHG